MERVASSTSASLLYSNGLIYLTEENGQTFIFKSEPNFKLVAKNDLREKTLSSLMSYWKFTHHQDRKGYIPNR